MRGAVALAGVSLTLGGCAFGAPDKAYSVEAVLADISSPESKLDGKTVSVHGWLGECSGNNCAVFSNLEDAKKVAAYHELPDDEWLPAFRRSLSIGGDADFDQAAQFMHFSEVVIVGEVNATWKKPDAEFGCLDRCDDIKPKSIQKILF